LRGYLAEARKQGATQRQSAKAIGRSPAWAKLSRARRAVYAAALRSRNTRGPKNPGFSIFSRVREVIRASAATY